MSWIGVGLRSSLLLAGVALAALAGCSRGEELPCEPAERYATANSTPPLRVPDELTVPGEAEVLRIPDEPGALDIEPATSCLESPPDFLDGAGEG